MKRPGYAPVLEIHVMTQTTRTIRKAKQNETEALAGLILAMALESEGRELNRATLMAGIQAVFNNPSLGTYWAVEDAGQLVACTLITVEWSDWNNAPYWWIQSLYIRPEYRGQGMFEQLLTTLESSAQAEGVRELRLYVEQNNQRAIRVYQRTGFESEHYHCMTKPLR
jgi:ribosomal protein S18 acetylase RimI-like enzyme